ncbi:MAG: hypothetical protein CMK09_17300 [Ponticaulis sp.]|nr:hypothetical protein [Ponticaulis sp.]|tara:strand:+ start:25839 stop:26315 length:477 start_codon:yes stop_codon:yes gene_type:complete
MATYTHLLACGLLLGIAGCSSAPKAYGPAGDSSYGYDEQPIEQSRYRVSYTAETEDAARRYALRRAAEVTQMNGGDWFQVVRDSTTGLPSARNSSPSVSVGGSIGSGGRSGLGIGFGLPLGGGPQRTITHSLEILVGSGETPSGVDVYDAADIIMNVR